MRVFVTGASGHIGSLVVPELLEAGHQVVGLARSDASVGAVASAGAEVVRGDLRDLETLRATASAADGVIHLAFETLSADMAEAVALELAAVTAIGEALAGSDKPLVATNASMTLALLGGITDRPATEEDVVPAGMRVDAENAVIALAAKSVRSSVVRIPALVHGELDRTGLFPQLIGIARSRGTSGYVGNGSNGWAAVHERDLAHLYRLALENAPAGTRLHAVAEDGITFRSIAETIAAGLDVPAESCAPEDLGFLGMFAALNSPISSEVTRQQLAWEPVHPQWMEDAQKGFYFADHA